MRPGGRRNGTDFSQNLCPAESSNQHNHLTKTRVSLRWKWWNNGGLTWFKHPTLGKMMVLWLSHCDNSPSNTGNFNGGSTIKTLETNWTKWWFYSLTNKNDLLRINQKFLGDEPLAFLPFYHHKKVGSRNHENTMTSQWSITRFVGTICKVTDLHPKKQIGYHWDTGSTAQGGGKSFKDRIL